MAKLFNRSSLMKKQRVIFISLGLMAASFLVYACINALAEEKVDFNKEVRPIINAKCISCHGGVKKSGGFSLLFREEALGKTKSGKPAIIPGDPDDSEFILRLSHPDPELRMPLEKDPLTKEEIDILKKWVKEGAQWEDHWAFIKPGNIEIPEVKDANLIKNDIDRFIQHKLGEVGLLPSPEAGKQTLIRRVSLDLTGLPPTPKEVDDFLQDSSSDAYEKVVNRLLQSPAYGEKWASNWLDLARYADSKGYEKDLHRNIWRYRDYVIKSLNSDKPYDQFTIEQLAGDLLPNPTDDQIIATAFHRNTMNNDEGGTDDEEFRVLEVIDRVNTTFDVWQGITMSCVQCHTHPYDPIRHEEYYKFMAFVNNTEDSDRADESPTFISREDIDEKKAEEIIKKIKELSADKSEVPTSIKDKRKKYLLSDLQILDYDEHSNIEVTPPSFRFLDLGAYVAYDKINLSGIKKIVSSYLSNQGGRIEVRVDKTDGPVIANLNFGATFNEFYETSAPVSKPLKGLHKVYFILKTNEKGFGDGRLLRIKLLTDEPKVNNVSRELDSLRKALSKSINPEGTPVMKELRGPKRRTTHVFTRGNWLAKGAKVKCEVPKIFNPMPKGAPQNRLGMAKWLTSKDNPLTARVAVNRWWEQLFGYGIVETPEDFGSQGTKPSHPELLDWLALKLMNDYEWSMKKTLKLMVMSHTYRQSSNVLPEHLAKDFRNKYLARGARFRLSAEQIRDQALAIGGLLSNKIYGPSVKPHRPAGFSTNALDTDVWKLSEGEDKYRRAVYTYLKRTSTYPSMLTFDAPSREFCIVRRIRTNTPLQALTTLNDTISVEVSVGLAKRMSDKEGNIGEKLKEGFKIAMARNPEKTELAELLTLYEKSRTYYDQKPAKAISITGIKEKESALRLAPLAIVAGVIINQDEFLTKE